ncbi:leucine--tRNA ligase [Candidatus Daviesbacteria bacterium RIFCSPHIGHO2_01_FULL_40_11]|uniref:Leucine--tRNA ligase n=1 Tax=Candidatus Daviesbacteria bacterium RIFCSPHIGHO2_01_FULL_40_11 TaxID=1797762 RepID=A0A1F5JG48_9BACT|nr:MAG: leucine--tRNA ligase [Candidatus Daviesbacteria bacterium RIFCSPHIGHO2_01_FULL_40_11]
MKKYIPSQIEPKRQKKWKEEKLFSPDLDQASKPFYNLMMFPYPSAEGLHVGNMYPFTGSDIFGRFKRMQGWDVFEPIGLDGFGIHSENYALEVNQHPEELSKVTEKRFYEQLMMIGDAYDWNRTVETYKPEFYKWTQWIFLQMYKKGLAYRKKASVNWCPKDKTVLADEQVVNGLCERCGSKVEQRMLEQWFFRITDYAERLLKNLETIDWSEKVKVAQRNWIGKKEGINIEYQVEEAEEKIVCFTTRPDTNFGATFVVIGPEHPFVASLQNSKLKEIQDYIEKTKNKSEADRIAEGRKKTGVFTGFYAINNLNGKKLPIWISDFVLGNVGTGAVVGVPGHDIRDFQFAKEFGLPVIRVVVGKDGDTSAITRKNQVQEAEGKMINSSFLDGLDIHEATQKIMDYLEEKGWGKRVTSYHLRDWLISRQRYWGPPIPIIYCDKCGIVPVPEKDLPVELPYVKEFRPTGTGKSPLFSVPDFYNVACPKCSGSARRETDVSDTFLDSAWYFLRYPSTEFTQAPFDEKRTKKWLPVDMYIGGAEHSVLHLFYSRFITMVLKDLGYLEFEEPFKTFFAHGLIIKDGAKMSKSKGNVINPDKYIEEYGADTLRVYLMFMGPLSEGGDFRDAGMNGIYRFLQRIWGLQEKVTGDRRQVTVQDQRIMHKTIKKVTGDIEQLKFNTAIASLMEWLNHLSRKEKMSVEEYKILLLLLAPFAPHVTEELWEAIGEKYSIHKQSWPKTDNKYLEEKEFTVAVQINGKVRDVLLIQKDTIDDREVVEKMAQESEKIQKFLAGKSVKKVVYIPGKIISFVVSN